MVSANMFVHMFMQLAQRLENSSALEGTSSLTEAAPTKAERNGTKMLSKVSGRLIAEEAREPSIDIALRARDQRWNWLGHNPRAGEYAKCYCNASNQNQNHFFAMSWT